MLDCFSCFERGPLSSLLRDAIYFRQRWGVSKCVATVLARPLPVSTWHCHHVPSQVNKEIWCGTTYLAWTEPWPQPHPTPLVVVDTHGCVYSLYGWSGLNIIMKFYSVVECWIKKQIKVNSGLAHFCWSRRKVCTGREYKLSFYSVTCCGCLCTIGHAVSTCPDLPLIVSASYNWFTT